MHRISLAPVLSATRSRVSAWIIGSLRLLDDLDHAPALELGERAGLDDAHDIADAGLVALVVGVQSRGAAHDLVVLGMRLGRVDADRDRLVHGGRDDDPAALLAAALDGQRPGLAHVRLALLGPCFLLERLGTRGALRLGSIVTGIRGLLGARGARGLGRGSRTCGLRSLGRASFLSGLAREVRFGLGASSPESAAFLARGARAGLAGASSATAAASSA